MPKQQPCEATFDGEGDLHLVCELPAGHEGYTHRDGDHEWAVGP